MLVLNTHVQRSRRYGFLASNACQHKPTLLCQCHHLGLPLLQAAEEPLSLSLSSDMLQEQIREVKANSSKVAGCIWPESATKASPKIQHSDAYSFCLKKQSCVD